MNRYDKEERIIQTFQDLKRWRIKIFPLNFNNILLKLGSTINEYDNSDYCVAGDIVDHRDGTISVKMGKPTAEELLSMIMEGISK